MASFNVATELWIPVVRLDGSSGEASLISVFDDAHTIRRIVGETPSMTAAIHRLLIACALRAFGPEDSAAWATLWTDKSFPIARLREYVARIEQHLDLFDPNRPFLQCPAVADVTPTSAAKLVPHRSTGNNRTLFDHTTANDETLLTPAEAARWLVTLQTYDPGGLKTPYHTTKSSQAAPGNRIAIMLVEGSTLKETLLLNMTPYDPGGEQPPMTTPADRPMWEADPPAPEPDERHSHGWTDLLTWPSRRVWLSTRTVSGETVVDKVVITPGTKLKSESRDVEWMAAFRRPRLDAKDRSPAAKKRQAKYGPWYAVRLQDRRGVWRHTTEFLLAPSTFEANNRQRALTLTHVADMVEDGHIPPETIYTLRVFGQQLDKNWAVIEQVFEETVAAPVALLRVDPKAELVIGYTVQLADQVGTALINMERDYRKTFQAKGDSNLDLAFWPQLAQPFDQFLRELAHALTSDRNVQTATQMWSSQVKDLGRKVTQRWVDGAPRRGRNIEAAAENYGRFILQLNLALRVYDGHLAGID
jgi:CRISPR system Cascade subunit CasA